MIKSAQERGEIAPGDHLVEATSGNTGIALAMAAAMMGYPITLILPSNATAERKAAMTAYGAKLSEVTPEQGMEGAWDLAVQMQSRGEGVVLDQFNNPDNPLAHYKGTGPEIWRDTDGAITTLSAPWEPPAPLWVSAYLKQQNPDIQIVGLQPEDGASFPVFAAGRAYMPGIFDAAKVDRVMDVSQAEAEQIAPPGH